MKKSLLLAGLAIVLAGGARAQGPSVVIPPAQIAVFKAGDNTGVWNISTARVQPCFVQVFDPAANNQPAPIFSLALPTNAPNGIWINAHAGSEGGGISRAANREYLALEGYTGNILSPTSAKPSSATNVTRGIGVLDAFGNETVVYSDPANWFGLPPGVTQNNPTGIATSDGVNFWGTGNVAGSNSEAAGTLFYNASVSPTPIELQNYIQAAAEARIINGTLYVVVPGSGVYNFLDPQNNDAVVPLPYDPSVPNPVSHIVLTNLFLGWGSAFQNVANFDMNAAGTIAYGADETFGIVKMVNNGAGWQQAPYYFSATNLGTLSQVTANQGCFGICVDFSGPNPIIYATTMENGTTPPGNNQGNVNQNRLIQIVDSGDPGSSLVAVTLATAGTTNESFRGIDFTPDLRPLITSVPANYSTTNGGSASFGVAGSSVFPLTYQWLQNGTNLAGQTAPVLQLSALDASLSGDGYQCVVANQYGSVTSAPAALLSVTATAQPPVATNAAAATTAFVGVATTFSAVFPTGTQPFTFQWYFGTQALVDGVKYSGSTSNSLTVSNLVVADSGNYYLVVSNAAGSVSNLADVLTVKYHLAAFAAGQPQSVTTFAGFSAVLTAPELGGTLPVTNQWYKGGVALTDANEFSGSATSTLAINPVGTNDAGSYTIVVSNGGGSVTSSVAKVTILLPPAPSFVAYSNQVYAQNFNTLPDPGTNSVNSINNPKDPGGIKGVAYSLSNPFDFAFPVVNSGFAGGLGLTNGLQGWYGAADTLFAGVDGITRFGAQDGDQTTGGVIDFGPNDGAGVVGTNRALGLLSTGTTGSTTFALKLVNTSTNALNAISLGFVGELWHNGTGHRQMSFGYTLDPTATNFVLTSESITNSVLVTNLAFSFPTALVVTTVDGTQSSNQAPLSVTNLPLAASWQPGGALWLVWSIDYYGSGSGNGYAIDNLQFSATNLPPVVGGTSVVIPPGKIALFKGGDNTGVWNISTARVQPCFVQIYDPAAVNQAAPLVSLALPTNAPNGIWMNAHAGSEGGGISRAANREYLALEGYTGNILSPTSAKPSSATNVTRGIGVMDVFGNETVVYSDLANWFGLPPGVTQNNPTGIATSDGTNFWGTGNVAGSSSEAAGTLFYNASVSPTPIELQNYIQAAAEARIINGTLYVVVPGGGVYNFLDPQNNDAVVPLPYDPSVPNPVSHIVLTNLFLGWGSAFQNVANFDMNTAGTIAYGADEALGIVKMVNNGAGWQQAPYYFSATNLGTLSQLAANQGCFGICVDFSGPNPIIYATTMENGTAPPGNAQGNPNQNRLIQIVDSGDPGANLAAVTLATAGTTNETFRGIDFTPDLRPMITSVPANYSTTNGGSASFVVGAASVYPLNYQWLQNGTNLAGQTGASLQLNGLGLALNGFGYQCVVANQYGSATSSPAAVLTVTALAQAPVVTNAASVLTAFVGGSTTFQPVFPNGTQPFAFQWYFGGQPLVDGLKYFGSTNNSLTVSNLALADSGNYYLVVGNGAGSTSNLADTLTVKYHLATITAGQPQSVTTFAGFSATLTATEIGGTLPVTNQWYKGGAALTDGNEFSGSGTSTLTINPAGTNDAGSYTIVVGNGGGSVTSSVAKVTVLLPPAPSFVAYSNQVYLQNFNTLPDPGTNSVNSINNPKDPGSIKGVAYSLSNPFDFAFPVVNSGFAGGLGLTNGLQGWYGAADTLFAGVDGITRFGAQDGDQTTGGVIDFGPNDSAGVVGTNRALGLLSTATTGSTTFALKLVNSSTNSLNSFNLSYLGELWHNGTGHRLMSFGYALDPTATNFVLTSESINGATLVTNLSFSFPTALVVTTVDGTQSSNQVSLAATSVPLTSTWQPGAALWLIWSIDFFGSGSGNGYAIDNLQFSATNNPQIALLLQPAIISQPKNSTVTNGASTSFSVSATSLFPLVYQWLFNSQPIGGATNSVLPLGPVDFTFAGNYQAVVANQFGAVTSAVASLTVLTSAVPPSITLQPASQTVFAGSNVVLSVAATGTGPFTYEWSVGPLVLDDSGDVSGSQTANLLITGAQPTDSGSYVAIVTGPGGVAFSQPADLTVINTGSSSASFVPYNTPGALYTQNFDSLPDPGATTVNTANPVTIGGVTYSLGNPFDFAAPVAASGSGGLGLSNSMAGWFGLAQAAVKAGASEGDQSTGGIISFGPTNSANANRALGLLATSTTGPTAFGVRFFNSGSTTLNQFSLQFTGELWRQQPAPKTLSFGYYVDLFGTAAFSTNVTAFLTNLDVNFPTNAFAPVDGTQPANQLPVSVTNQPIADWPPGAALWLVWQMTNAAGTSQGLAIDNLTFSASTALIPQPVLTGSVSLSGVTLTWPVSGTTFTLQQSSDLTQPGGGWSNVPQPSSVVGGVNSVTVSVPFTGTVLFFRLAH